VSFAIALCAALLVAMINRPGRGRIAAGMALVFIFGLGHFFKQVEWTTPVGLPLKVSLLQGNIPQDLKVPGEPLRDNAGLYKRMIDASDGRLIVLPETAIPRFLEDVDPRYLDVIARSAADRGADILLGVPVRAPGGQYFKQRREPRASPIQRYDKAHLVPFGEFVPYGFHWIVNTVAIPMADFSLASTIPSRSSSPASGGPQHLLGRRLRRGDHSPTPRSDAARERLERRVVR